MRIANQSDRKALPLQRFREGSQTLPVAAYDLTVRLPATVATIVTTAILAVARLEPALGIQRRHAARAGRGYGLAINPVGAISRHEHARHVGHRAFLRDDVAVGVHFDHTFENL
jgi:hypothetical protein